jgi:hypothetical protein
MLSCGWTGHACLLSIGQCGLITGAQCDGLVVSEYAHTNFHLLIIRPQLSGQFFHLRLQLLRDEKTDVEPDKSVPIY